MGQARKSSNMMFDSSSFGGTLGLAITEDRACFLAWETKAFLSSAHFHSIY